jgi:hypothetical protein
LGNAMALGMAATMGASHAIKKWNDVL